MKMDYRKIKKALSEGRARELFGGAGSISIEVEGIGSVVFDVVAYDSEDIVDRDKTHSMTLWMRDLLLEPMKFNEMDINKWEDSDIRKYINSENFINRFESGFRELLCSVYKKNGDRARTKDMFFLLSKEELNGGYEFIKSDKDCMKANKNGEKRWHRIRSAGGGITDTTWYIKSDGSTCGGSCANWLSYFAPACVIAV